MKLPVGILTLALLGGCSTLRTALLPTPVPCAPADSPTPPKVISDALLAKMDGYHTILIIASERLELISYAAQADAIIVACKTPGAVAPATVPAKK